jgi:bacillolysin
MVRCVWAMQAIQILDIIAHEFTHGVTQTSANLVYSKESGALNESFSDIFGISCYNWFSNGNNPNIWLIGFDRKNPANTAQSLYIRNMSNPNDKGDPDTYLGTNWVSTTTPTDVGGDNWGVHRNSGVQNFMYFLLVNGGIGVNDNGTNYTVTGIGINNAQVIAYRALTVYLSINSQYADARNAWIHAAVDLYGSCSNQAIEVGKAWNAVGLAPPVINQTTNYCGTFGSTIFTANSPNIFSLSPNCTMIVNPANQIQFGANKVIVNPGFNAQTGSNFRAYVSDCRFAAF